MVAEIKLGSWTLLEEVGRGGMGVVYRAAHDMLPDKQFAIKQVRPELAHDETTRQRFLREIRIALNLQHPNIVPTSFGTRFPLNIRGASIFRWSYLAATRWTISWKFA